MTVFAKVNVSRPNVSGTILANQPVQIDETSEIMAAYYNASHPYDVFEIYVAYTTFAFHRNDELTDITNIDPLTQATNKYRIVGNVATFPDGHVEMKANRFAGPS